MLSLAVPEVGPHAFSGPAGCTLPHSAGWLGNPGGETGPLRAPSPPRVLELAASKAADFSAFDGAVGACFHGDRGQTTATSIHVTAAPQAYGPFQLLVPGARVRSAATSLERVGTGRGRW